MQAYAPNDVFTVALVMGVVILNVVWGFVLTRLPAFWARVGAWSTAVVGVAVLHIVLIHEPAGVRMVGFIAMVLTSLKAVVVVESQLRGMRRLSPMEWFNFLMWLGMRPTLFVRRRGEALEGAHALLVRGAIRLLIGAVFLAAARWVWVATSNHAVTAGLMLVGLSLMLHFGICNLLAGIWRVLGVATYPLFRAPLFSQSLGEFWARRWNVAFSEMTAIGVYGPLAGKVGRSWALLAAFAVSGVIHEVVITFPVQTGLGLPSLYFALHGALVFVERALASRNVHVSGVWGRVWTFVWVVVPLPILFHPPFIDGVVLPIIGVQHG